MTKYKSWMWRRETDRSVCPVSGHTVVRVFPSQNLSGFSFCGFQPRCSADLKTYFVAVGHMVTLTFFFPVGLCVARPSHSHRSLLSLCLQWCCRELSCVPHQVLGLLQSQAGSLSHVRVQDLPTFLVCLPAVGNLSWSHPTPSSCPSPEVCILFIGLYMCLPVA